MTSFHPFVRFFRYSPVFLLAAGLACSSAPAQTTPERTPTALPAPGAANAAPFGNGLDQDQTKMMHNMLKQRNSIRQKEIVDDTNRLLDLARQLKDAVDKSGKDELSISVVNTASEMEKLAKAVKEKMRDGQ